MTMVATRLAPTPCSSRGRVFERMTVAAGKDISFEDELVWFCTEIMIIHTMPQLITIVAKNVWPQ